VTNSLANRDPEVARQWHPTRNDGVRPKDVVYTSNRMHWWKCPRGPDHEWRAVASSRTRKKQVGCPYCAGQYVSVTNSLATRCPRVARDWDKAKNGTLTPKDVGFGSRQHVWWRCTRNSRHLWKAEIRARAQRTKGCPFCSHRRLSPEFSLAALKPRVAAQWHPTKNGNLRPEDVMAGSARQVWWKCPEGSDHVWRAEVSYRARAVKPVGCPCCSGLRASTTNSIASLAPHLAREWHPTKNGALRPRDVTLGSSRRVWWKCPESPAHEWCAGVRGRTGPLPGKCPFCQGRRACATNSLAKRNPRVARQWHPTKNGKLRPEDVTTGSSRQVWWHCKKDARHVWRSEIKGRVSAQALCPFCAGVR